MMEDGGRHGNLGAEQVICYGGTLSALVVMPGTRRSRGRGNRRQPPKAVLQRPRRGTRASVAEQNRAKTKGCATAVAQHTPDAPAPTPVRKTRSGRAIGVKVSKRSKLPRSPPPSPNTANEPVPQAERLTPAPCSLSALASAPSTRRPRRVRRTAQNDEPASRGAVRRSRGSTRVATAPKQSPKLQDVSAVHASAEDDGSPVPVDPAPTTKSRARGKGNRSRRSRACAAGDSPVASRGAAALPRTPPPPRDTEAGCGSGDAASPVGSVEGSHRNGSGSVGGKDGGHGGGAGSPGRQGGPSVRRDDSNGDSSSPVKVQPASHVPTPPDVDQGPVEQVAAASSVQPSVDAAVPGHASSNAGSSDAGAGAAGEAAAVPPSQSRDASQQGEATHATVSVDEGNNGATVSAEADSHGDWRPTPPAVRATRAALSSSAVQDPQLLSMNSINRCVRGNGSEALRYTPLALEALRLAVVRGVQHGLFLYGMDARV